MNENTKKFRNAMGGYNKEDVNAFIQEYDLANREKQDALQKELDMLTTERETWLAEKEQLQAENAKLQSAVEEQQKQVAAQTETIRQLQQQVEEIETILTTNMAEKAKLTEQVEQQYSTIHALQEKLAAAETSRTEAETALTAEKERAAQEIDRIKAAYLEEENGAGYKIRMYDRISGQIGDILLGANRDADDIMRSAKEEAERMRTETADMLAQERSAVQAELDQLQADTKAEAVCVRKKLSETAGTLLADISGEMHLNIENCLKELSTCMTEVESDTETLFQTMQRRYQEMNERIQYYQSCMQEHIDARLTEMDEQYAIQESGREN